MPDSILIVGSTGLIGKSLADALDDKHDGPLHLLLRSPAKQEFKSAKVHIAATDDWENVISSVKPDKVVSCLGSTMKKAGSKEAFAAIDRDLVGRVAKASKANGTTHFISVSSTMADSNASSFYLKTKGQAEDLLRAESFDRLDIVRPGLLRGERVNDSRLGESLAILASPVMDLLLQGSMRRFRSIAARDVASAIARLLDNNDQGSFVHENDEIWSLI